MKNFFILASLLILFLNQSCDDLAQKGLVHDLESLHSAIQHAVPGDEITMANGVWKDVEIVFETHGEKDNLIYLTAQEPGKVLIEGCSWKDSAPFKLHLTNGEPITKIINCTLENSGKIIANNNEFATENITYSN